MSTRQRSGAVIVCGHTCGSDRKAPHIWCGTSTYVQTTGRADNKHGNIHNSHHKAPCLGGSIRMSMSEYTQYLFSGTTISELTIKADKIRPKMGSKSEAAKQELELLLQPKTADVFTVAFIANPISAATSQNHAKSSLLYCTATIHKLSYFLCLALHKTHIFLLHPMTEDNDYVQVVVENWLFIMISIHEQDKQQVSPSSPNFRFEFLDWYAIMGRVPSTSAAQLEDRWGRYAGVVGVPYTSISEIDPKFLCNELGINIRTLLLSLDVAAKLTAFWPPLRETTTTFFTSELETLEIVAQNHTNTARPTYHVISPTVPSNPSHIVKNAWGGSVRHILQPRSFPITYNHLTTMTPNHSKLWISQQFIPSLYHHGHWSVFFVGGHIIQVLYVQRVQGHVHTIHEGGNRASKEELQQFEDNTFSLNVVHQLTPAIEDMHTEFVAFLETTFKGLQIAESKQLAGDSSLSTFCRLDIGLMDIPSGISDYFVHQVHRHLDCALWLNCWSDGPKTRLIERLSTVMYRYLYRANDPVGYLTKFTD